MNPVVKTSPSPSETRFVRSWIIWGCAALFYFYQFLLRVSPSVMTEDLMAAFQLDACSLGTLTACYYYAYASLQIPVGALMDRFKPRRLLTFATLLCGLGTFMFSTADSLTLAAIGRAMIGAGSAFAFLSCLKLATLWFPSQRLPFIIGLTVLLGTAGGSATYPIGLLVQSIGWRQALVSTGFIGLSLAILVWTIVKDRPPPELEEEVLKSHGDSPAEIKQQGLFSGVLEVIRKPQSWMIALYGFLMYVPLSGFADQWGAPFLMSAYNFDKATAGGFMSVFYIGIGCGCPLFPFLTHRLQSYKKPTFISALGALIFLLPVVYITPLPLGVLSACLFASGFFLGGQFIAFSMTCALNPLSVSASAGGFHNMICMLSGVIMQPFIGWLLNQSWNGEYLYGIPSYTSTDYSFALTSIILCLILGCFIVGPIKETYPKQGGLDENQDDDASGGRPTS